MKRALVFALAALPFVLTAGALTIVFGAPDVDPAEPTPLKSVAPPPAPSAPKAKEVHYEPWELVST